MGKEIGGLWLSNTGLCLREVTLDFGVVEDWPSGTFAQKRSFLAQVYSDLENCDRI
jgi:hypothetical protein